MRVDVVMLTNTADWDIYKMTCEAIRSLRLSDECVDFNVILVESAEVVPGGWDYDGIADLVVRTPAPFNYNQALNVGFDKLSPVEGRIDLTQCVVICNNDLVFRRGWFSEMNLAMIEYNLDVASPVSPGWPPHEELCKQLMSTTFFGTRTSYEVAGWCFCIRRDALDAIRPFNEKFAFEFQDVAMVKELQRAGYGKMALVRHSQVVHLLNQSHRLIENRQGMIEGAVEIYREVYGE
jgi:hypothetical protein